ncbi:MAG: hypothetical protein ACM3O4_04210 [Ignavibacteriales bacterium]
MKKIFILMCTFVIVISLTACKSEDKLESNYDSIREKIERNMEKILSESDGFSSIPSTYIENEYYSNIVKLGDEAVPVLIDLYKEVYHASLMGYISALAVQDITDCDLKEKYNLSWSNASEFFKLWEDHNCSFNN